jgi:hypothetical protein
VRSVSSPRPSNRACGSPAHGSPTPFTGGVRPEPARPGWAWVRRRFQDVPAVDLVIQRVESSSGISLGRPVKRMLQGTDRVERLDPEGGTSHDGTHRPLLVTRRMDEAAALPSPAVVLSVRVDQYYGRLRRRPGWSSTSRLLTGYRTPRSDAVPQTPDRGRPPQFPPSPSERSAPSTPGSS